MTSGDKQRHLFPIALLGLDFGFQSLSFLAAILIIAPCVEKPSLFQMVLKTILSIINHVIVLSLLRISIFFLLDKEKTVLWSLLSSPDLTPSGLFRSGRCLSLSDLGTHVDHVPIWLQATLCLEQVQVWTFCLCVRRSSQIVVKIACCHLGHVFFVCLG